MGAYLNGKLPANIVDAGYKVVDAFPSLRFKDPIRVVQRPGTNLLWVVCQDGEIWSFDKTSASAKSLVLDIKDRCVGHDAGEGDSGLLGIAFHPQFGQTGSPNRGYIYVWYSFRPVGAGWSYYSYNRLSRFTLADGATTISPSSELILINQYDRKTWHDGGGMFFGADGFLYVSNGDEGDGPHDWTGTGTYSNSQKINDGLFSGVLRIDVDMNASTSHAIRRQPKSSATPPAGWPGSYSQNYFIPNDNPWQSTSGSYLEEFYAIGLRSPHSLTLDSVTGKALVSDTGRDQQEEIDVLAKGANYQWAFLEGTTTGPNPGISGPGTSTPPIHTIVNRTVDGSALIGGWVYRGSQFASDLGGKYVFGDFISNKVWALDWQTPGAARRWLVTVPRIPNLADGITGVSVDAAGEIYITVHGPEGRIYKLASTAAFSTPPATLSATLAFSNLATLTPAAGIVPFTVNSALWSDGAEKNRWVAVPNDGAPYAANETVTFAATGQWSFPVGTVTIKHFDLPTNDTNPALKKRMETRFLVRTQDGWYGLTYLWRADGSDADLVPAGGATANVAITQADGSTRIQKWDFPSRENCMGCHTQLAGFALGVNTRQLNGNFIYPSTGITANQLATWSAIGMFNTTLTTSQIAGSARTFAVTDTTGTLEQRMRSYFDANCSHCHQPGGVMRSEWDARFDTPLASQGIVNAVPVNDFGITGSKIITPGNNDKSLIYVRMNDDGNPQVQMPPVARNVRHDAAVDVLRLWIAQLSTGVANQAPVVVQPASQSSVRGTAASLQISASDPDGNTITYSAIGLPAGLGISATTGLISGTVSTTAALSNSVTVTVSDGSLSNSKSFTWTTSDATGPGSLTGADIGAVGVVGSTALANGVYTVKGSGSDIYFASDSFQFAYTSITGDGEIRARVTSQTNTAAWAKAGVMMRETLTGGSRHATTYITPYETRNGFEMLKRTATSGATTDIGGPANNAPPNNWVRLVRVGNTITGYASANGTTWTQIHAATYTSLPASLYFGLAVTSVNNSVLGTATFDNVQIIGGSTTPTVPAAPTSLAASAQSSSSIRLTWTDAATNETNYRIERATGTGAYAIVATLAADSVSYTDSGLAASTSYNYKVSAFNSAGSATAGPVNATTLAASGGTTLVGADIGPVGVAGSTSLSGGVYTLRGSGADIYYTADSFHFASAIITGDGEIKARVTSQTNTASWAKAGVMMRETSAVGARHATMYITPYETRNGFEYLSRSTTNGSTTDVSGPANNAPPNNWVRLVRAGNTITGYASANGTTWTLVRAVTFTSLPSNLMFGLAVTSVNNSVLGTATFDNVQITSASGAVLAASAASTSFANWAEGSGLSGTSLDPLAAPANDGISNLIKYAFNLEPLVSGAPSLAVGTGTFGLPAFSTTGPGVGAVLRVEFVRRFDGSLVYRPKKSTDLVTWQSFISTPFVTPVDAIWERVVYEEPLDAASSMGVFGLVEVSIP